LNREMANWMVGDQSLHELRISFDGAREKTLERIRRGASFETILHNMDYLTALKRKHGCVYPKMGFRYVIMRSNAEELPDIFKLCVRYGLYKVEVIYLNVTNDMDTNESMFNHRDLTAHIFKEANRKACEYGIQLDLPPLPRKRNMKCLKPWEYFIIDSDGSVRFCSKSWRQRLGFFDDGFEAIWRGEHYRRIRRSMDSHAPYFPYCRHCSERKGFNLESSHNHRLHEEDYTIKGLENLQVQYNQRDEENALSFRQIRGDRENRGKFHC